MEEPHNVSRQPLEGDALQEYALKLLGARDYAAKELRDRLLSRAAREEDVEAVIDRLREIGFLDEHRFAKQKAEEATERRTVGKRRVQQELAARGVDEQAIREAVEEAYGGQDEAALALAHLETQLSGLLRGAGLEDQRALQRAYGRLRRAGFRHADAVTALRVHSKLAATMDEFAPDDEG